MRTSVCWSGTKSNQELGGLNFSDIQISSNPIINEKLMDILKKYSGIFSGKIGHTKLINNEIRLKVQTPNTPNPYPYHPKRISSQTKW